MTRHHFTDSGAVNPCHATVKDCPYLKRPEVRHFDSKAEAEEHAAGYLISRYGKLVTSRKPINALRRIEESRRNRAGHITLGEEDSLLNNRAPEVGQVPSGIAYNDFSQALAQLSGSTNWYYRTATN